MSEEGAVQGVTQSYREPRAQPQAPTRCHPRELGPDPRVPQRQVGPCSWVWQADIQTDTHSLPEGIFPTLRQASVPPMALRCPQDPQALVPLCHLIPLLCAWPSSTIPIFLPIPLAHRFLRDASPPLGTRHSASPRRDGPPPAHMLQPAPRVLCLPGLLPQGRARRRPSGPPTCPAQGLTKGVPETSDEGIRISSGSLIPALCACEAGCHGSANLTHNSDSEIRIPLCCVTLGKSPPPHPGLQ